MRNRNEIRPAGATQPRNTADRVPWWDLEENHPHGGMWQMPTAGSRDGFITASAGLMAEPARFADSMRDALSRWPRSVVNALSTPGLNLRAWLGHAGCFLATGSPEETTRLGWHTLNEFQQRDANAAADTVIEEARREAAAVPTDQPELWDM